MVLGDGGEKETKMKIIIVDYLSICLMLTNKKECIGEASLRE